LVGRACAGADKWRRRVQGAPPLILTPGACGRGFSSSSHVGRAGLLLVAANATDQPRTTGNAREPPVLSSNQWSRQDKFQFVEGVRNASKTHHPRARACLRRGGFVCLPPDTNGGACGEQLGGGRARRPFSRISTTRWLGPGPGAGADTNIRILESRSFDRFDCICAIQSIDVIDQSNLMESRLFLRSMRFDWRGCV